MIRNTLGWWKPVGRGPKQALGGISSGISWSHFQGSYRDRWSLWKGRHWILAASPAQAGWGFAPSFPRKPKLWMSTSSDRLGNAAESPWLWKPAVGLLIGIPAFHTHSWDERPSVTASLMQYTSIAFEKMSLGKESLHYSPVLFFLNFVLQDKWYWLAFLQRPLARHSDSYHGYQQIKLRSCLENRSLALLWWPWVLKWKKLSVCTA